MIKPLRRPRVGLLLLAPERFCALGEGTLGGTYLMRKTEEARRMAEDAAALGDITFPGIVFSHGDARAAMDAFYLAKVDCVLALTLSWAEDFAYVRFLRDMPPLPILFAHRVAERIDLTDTHDEEQFTRFLCHGGLVGSLEASAHGVNLKRPMMETFVGTWQAVLERAGVFANAARARAILRESRVGLLACYNEAMWGTYVHPYDVFAKVGPELHFLSISELVDGIAAIPDGRAQEVLEAIAARYPVMPDVAAESFLRSVQASMAMEDLAQARGLDLLVLNDIDTVLLDKVGLRPGFCPTPGRGDLVTVPEGDLGGGLATYILRLLSGGPVHFIEPFHMDLPEENFAAGHAGPNDYTDPAGSTKIARDVRFAKSKWKYAGAPFAWHVFGTGRKTMLHMSYHQGRFLLASTLVDCLPTDHFLASYSHGLFRPVGQGGPALFEKLLRLGVTQHFGLAAGDWQPVLADLGRMLGFDTHQL